jgi:gliding motility-associated-like protein
MSKSFRNTTILSLVFCYSHVLSFSQSTQFFVRRGNNISKLSCGGVVYAPLVNKYHQAFGAGAIWARNQVDLRNPFNINFILDFTDTTAVDGGAFVFQTDSNSVGEAFNGFGYRKIDHSIAITFDIEKNTYDDDPDFNHIAIQANGVLNHSNPNNLAGPLTIEQFFSFLFGVKQFHHLITITWDPLSTLLSAAIDNKPYISVKDDIIRNIFNGNSMVYWGFTGSNTQSLVYPPEKELTFGYMNFSFGDVIPRYRTEPLLDTCFTKPIYFFDSSLYNSDFGLLNLRLFKWFWNFGDGTISTERNPLPHDYPGAGNYQLKFTATNQLGCTTDTLSRIIRLGSKPNPDFSVDILCTNAATVFKDLTKNAVGLIAGWKWDFGNGNPSIDKNPTTTFTTPGIKTVMLAVSSEFGCRGDTTKIITVTDRPEAGFTYIKNCEGLVSYLSQIKNNTPIKEWQWSFGDHLSSTLPDPVHHFQKNDSYATSFIVTSESGCISDTIKANIVINKVYAFAGNDTILSAGQPLQLHASGGTVYSWSPSTGLSNPAVDNPIAMLSQNQAYYLRVKNAEGCEGHDTILIKVYNGPDLYVPTAFTPDRNGLNDLFLITAPGLKQLDYIRVYDRWGKLVFETKDIKKGWDGTVNHIEQGTGTYVWIIKAVDYKDKILFKKGTVTLIR